MYLQQRNNQSEPAKSGLLKLGILAHHTGVPTHLPAKSTNECNLFDDLCTAERGKYNLFWIYWQQLRNWRTCVLSSKSDKSTIKKMLLFTWCCFEQPLENPETVTPSIQQITRWHIDKKLTLLFTLTGSW